MLEGHNRVKISNILDKLGIVTDHINLSKLQIEESVILDADKSEFILDE